MNLHQSPIRTRPEGACHVCGGAGEVGYTGLHDRLFGVSGEWVLRRCQNRNCGLLWLDPKPIEEDLPRLYENYFTHSLAPTALRAPRLREAIKHDYWTARYGNAANVDARARAIAAFVRLVPALKEELDLAVFELPVKRGGHLLEIGCGNGSAMRRMADLGWKAHGVDFDEKAVAVARSCDLDVRLGSVEAQGYPSGSFDAVVMSHVLEHVPDPRALLAECRRILKADGRLASITPNALSRGHKVFGRHWRGLEPPRHLHIFTAASLRSLARETGWSRVVIKSSIANAYGMTWASNRLRRDDQLDVASWPDPGSLIFRLSQTIAAVRHRFSPGIGEELILHAVKDE